MLDATVIKDTEDLHVNYKNAQLDQILWVAMVMKLVETAVAEVTAIIRQEIANVSVTSTVLTVANKVLSRKSLKN